MHCIVACDGVGFAVEHAQVTFSRVEHVRALSCVCFHVAAACAVSQGPSHGSAAKAAQSQRAQRQLCCSPAPALGQAWSAPLSLCMHASIHALREVARKPESK